MKLSDRIISDVATFRDGKKKFKDISKDGYTSNIFPNAGVEFEYLMIRLFELSGLNICYPISEKTQQIDGVIYLNQIPFLVESKFYKTDKIDIEPIAKLMIRMQARPSYTMGLIIAKSGVTTAALEYMKFLQPKNIILFQGDEIDTAINCATQKNRLFHVLLEKKVNALIERGVFNYHLNAILEDIK